jgi:ABC-type phosphate/phosphonate transport system substrate-binding protein
VLIVAVSGWHDRNIFVVVRAATDAAATNESIRELKKYKK